MRNNHKASISTRSDFSDAWKIHSLWKNPNVKTRVMKCSVCHPKSPVNIKKANRILSLDAE